MNDPPLARRSQPDVGTGRERYRYPALTVVHTPLLARLKGHGLVGSVSSRKRTTVAASAGSLKIS
jgi:hypothetical protein